MTHYSTLSFNLYADKIFIYSILTMYR